MRKIKNIIVGIILCLSAFTIWDFLFNNMIYLTRFSEWIMEFLKPIANKISESLTDAFMKSMGQ